MFEFKQIEYTQAVKFLLPKHYSGRIYHLSLDNSVLLWYNIYIKEIYYEYK